MGSDKIPKHGLLSGMILPVITALVLPLAALFPSFRAKFNTPLTPELLVYFWISALLMTIHKIESYYSGEYDRCPVYLTRGQSRRGLNSRKLLFVGFVTTFIGMLMLLALSMSGPPWHLLIITVWLAQGLHELHHSAKSAARRRIYPGLFSSFAFVGVQVFGLFPLWWDAVIGERGHAYTACLALLPIVWLAFYAEDRDWISRTPAVVWDQPAWSWEVRDKAPCSECASHHGGPGLGSHSTAQDVLRFFRANLKGKLAVVTGGTAGLGAETAKNLALAGCRVIITSRTTASAEAAAERLMQALTVTVAGAPPHASGVIIGRALDLESLASVRAFAQSIQHEKTIDYLVLNAGVGGLSTLQYTPHGFERHLGTNHFGHFYLFSLLRSNLTAQSDPCRVVVLASIAHNMGSVDLNDLHFRHGRIYTSWGAYGQSKTANMLFAKELAAQLMGTGVTPVSVHPGIVLTSQPEWLTTGVLGMLFRAFAVDKTVSQGAATVLYACLEPSLAQPEKRGSYLADCAIARPSTAEARDPSGEGAKALWAVTEAQLKDALSRESAPGH